MSDHLSRLTRIAAFDCRTTNDPARNLIVDSCTRSMNAADIQYGLRQAPPVGRALRILFGVVLIVYVTPVYFRVPVGVAVGSLLLMLGLIGVYSLIHIGVSRWIVGQRVAAILAAGLLAPRCMLRALPGCRSLAAEKAS